MATVNLRAFDSAGLSAAAQLNLASTRSATASLGGGITASLLVAATLGGTVVGGLVEVRAFDSAGMSEPAHLTLTVNADSASVGLGGTVQIEGVGTASLGGEVGAIANAVQVRAFDASGVSSAHTLYIYVNDVVPVTIGLGGSVAIPEVTAGLGGNIVYESTGTATLGGEVADDYLRRVSLGGSIVNHFPVVLRFESTGDAPVYRTVYLTMFPMETGAALGGTVATERTAGIALGGEVLDFGAQVWLDGVISVVDVPVNIGLGGEVALEGVRVTLGGTVQADRNVPALLGGRVGVAGLSAGTQLAGLVQGDQGAAMGLSGLVASEQPAVVALTGFVETGRDVLVSLAGLVQVERLTSVALGGMVDAGSQVQVGLGGWVRGTERGFRCHGRVLVRYLLRNARITWR